ncbi:MAG: alpha/beta fold hydrolase [Pseudomonadales bacterium]|mgnify:CR=1 FL=1|jgi:alpha-beta hydrolase superfamily lysophospholipase|nr:alpha/beta fold hydrolase [Pseudomonadales bacterium]
MVRIALAAIGAMVILTSVGVISEGISFIGEIPDEGESHRFLRLALLGFANLVFLSVLAMIAALYLWARMARSLPDLKGWHLQMPKSEFCRADATPEYHFSDYLKQEEKVFRELDAYIHHDWSGHATDAYNRYAPDSVSNPENVSEHNWNRSRILQSPNPKGGVLLLHGLSDSPYSLRALGERLHAEGYTVVWLRVPGHGTNPRALAEVTWQDWTSAVQVAVRGLRDLVPDERPLVLAGYSNGGALSLNYVLTALEDSTLPSINSILLFSPMIGVNPLARITRLYHAVGLISQNEKSKWSSIFAEIDPYKFSSWPMNANVQAWGVTREVEKKLAALEKSNRLHQLPPILAMQSVVDSTVVVPKLITVLFDRLKSEQSELFLFDVNRMDSLSNLLNLSFEVNVQSKLAREDRPFRLTLMGNKKPESDQLTIKSRVDGKWTEHAVEAMWPKGTVSLSHVAVPIPSEDPIYGAKSETGQYSLGTLSMRAEPSALMIPNSLFIRCRHNPFYHLMENHAIRWLSQQLETPTSNASGKIAP